MMNRNRGRDQGRTDCGMDITLTSGVNDQGQAYTYGKAPDVSRQNGVESELYYDGVEKY